MEETLDFFYSIFKSVWPVYLNVYPNWLIVTTVCDYLKISAKIWFAKILKCSPWHSLINWKYFSPQTSERRRKCVAWNWSSSWLWWSASSTRKKNRELARKGQWSLRVAILILVMKNYLIEILMHRSIVNVITMAK